MRIGISIAAVLFSSAAAADFDNEAGVYTLTTLPSAQSEAERMDRMQLSDQQPAGRFVRKGETLIVSVDDLPEGASLSAVVGFAPMWNSKLSQQVQPVDGETRFRANQDGPLFFLLNADDDAEHDVDIRVQGGEPLPLYVDGAMDAQDWAEELSANRGAPFVQLLGQSALITLPANVYERDPIDDPVETFATIDRVIELQNELAGFDGETPRDRPTRLRIHYLVDFRVSAKDREEFYMYATDQFVGMLDDNTADLTDPAKLRQSWGIWHETGHTHQQNSWTFLSFDEVNVNLFSLYVQEAFGRPNWLGQSEDGEPTHFDRAREYLDGDPPSFLDSPNDDNLFFIRLVMLYQLKETYGWDFYKDLHKHFRMRPLGEDAEDQDKADAFIEAACELTGTDLRPFFERWALRASDTANDRIDDQGLPLSEGDPASIFE